MRNPISDKIQTRQPSGIRKFFDIVSEMKDAISLGVGEPDFDTPWPVIEEGIRSLSKGKTHYTGNSGLKELRVAINEFLDRKYGIKYDPENETVSPVRVYDSRDENAAVKDGEEAKAAVEKFLTLEQETF